MYFNFMRGKESMKEVASLFALHVCVHKIFKRFFDFTKHEDHPFVDMYFFLHSNS